MKQCPKCDQVYSDETLNFCLTDGSQLTRVAIEEPTVVIERPVPPVRKRSYMWAVVAALLVLIVLVMGAIMAVFWLGKRLEENGSRVNSPATVSTPKPKPSTSMTVETVNSPTPAVTGSPKKGDGSDEITPIAWETTGGGFKGEPGQTYQFECPPDGTPQAVWGSDTYTDYSSICTAAVHAGIITIKEGGVVTLEYRPGRALYGSTTRHDIKTNTTGENARSFIVR